MKINHPISLRVSPVDKEDLNEFVELGIFRNFSDAGRGVLRIGIEQVKKTRGVYKNAEAQND